MATDLINVLLYLGDRKQPKDLRLVRSGMISKADALQCSEDYRLRGWYLWNQYCLESSNGRIARSIIETVGRL
jgi:hypothetical protein